MVFIRTKTIKGKDYYYLVKSTREKDKVKQKTLKYLGPEKPKPREIQSLKKKYKEGENADHKR